MKKKTARLLIQNLPSNIYTAFHNNVPNYGIGA